MLLQCGAQRLILALDPDAAGKKAANKIRKQFDNIFSIEIINLKDKDVGDMSIEQISNIFEEVEV